MRIPLLVLGALVAIVLIVVGVTMTVDAAGSLSDVRIEDTRTAIPGSKDVQLDEGKYVVFYEVTDDAATAGEEGGLDVPPLNLRVSGPGALPPLELDNYSTDFNVSGGGREAQAIATVEIPEDGTYTIAVSRSADPASPSVVLGKPITHRALRLGVGITGVLAGLASLALVSALTIGLAVRAKTTKSAA